VPGNNEEGRMSKVREVVEGRTLNYIVQESTAADAARRMAELHCGAILVLKDGQLKGVFSERDLMHRVVLAKLDPEKVMVGSVMSTDLATIDESASLETAMEAMLAHGCRHLPVMSGTQVVAFLSMRDLMNFELARKTEELLHIQAYIQRA
jgi:signal-transduction protein with cAMP-binding, CBS, and nucleotidyltransferase domain